MPPIDFGTYIRTIALFVTLINQLLAIYGISPLPFNSAEVELFASTLLAGIASVIAWWKDNDITRKARLRKRTLDK